MGLHHHKSLRGRSFGAATSRGITNEVKSSERRMNRGLVIGATFCPTRRLFRQCCGGRNGSDSISPRALRTVTGSQRLRKRRDGEFSCFRGAVLYKLRENL